MRPIDIDRARRWGSPTWRGSLLSFIDNRSEPHALPDGETSARRCEDRNAAPDRPGGRVQSRQSALYPRAGPPEPRSSPRPSVLPVRARGRGVLSGSVSPLNSTSSVVPGGRGPRFALHGHTRTSTVDRLGGYGTGHCRLRDMRARPGRSRALGAHNPDVISSQST